MQCCILSIGVTTATAKSLQSCLTLWDPIDSSPLGSSVPGILQARTPEWVAISFSNAWKWKVKVKFLSRVRLLATPWTAAFQAPPSMGFSRQEYWSGVPLSVPLLHGKEKEKRWNLWQISSFWALKSLQMVTRAMKSENDCFLAGKLWETSTVCWKSEPLFCWQRSIQSRLWSSQWSRMLVRAGL